MSELRDRIEAALDALESGETDAAIDLFDDVGRHPPDELGPLDKGSFWELAGNLAMAQGRPSDAHDAYQNMIRHERRGGATQGGIGNSHGKVGEALAACGRHRDAIEAFRKGIEMMRGDDEARPTYIATLNFQLAESLLALEEYRDAAGEYRETIKLAEKEPDARSLGFLNYRLAMALEPLALFEQTFNQVRQLANELSDLGIDSDELDQMLSEAPKDGTQHDEEAKLAYRTALEHLEDASDTVLHARVSRDYGKLLRHGGDSDGAREALESARELAETTRHGGLRASIFYEIGENELDREDYVSAITAFADVLELQCGWEASALQGASRAALGAGDGEKAVQFAEEAVGLLGDDAEDLPEAYENLAVVYQALDRQADADGARVKAEELRG